jgi:hypothetical protein
MKSQIMFAMMFALLLAAPGLAVVEDFGDLDQDCFEESVSLTGDGVALYFGAIPVITNRTELVLVDSCAGGNGIVFDEGVDLILGPIQPDEVVITDDSIFVDSDLRPDLDVPAQIVFQNQPFAVKPDLIRDGSQCFPPDCVVNSYLQGKMVATVDGFSNYTLSGSQDFTVYSDEAPELQGKIYQVLDLGDANRGEVFKCQVMIFAQDAASELVLVQTNPERKVQGKLLGNPDSNQPESLGYFPTENGVANVYFRNDMLVGYTDFQYVAQCQNNSTQLIFEETITPVNSPLGRNFAGRAVWATTDNNGQNMFFVVFYGIVGLLAFSLLMMWFRRARGR